MHAEIETDTMDIGEMMISFTRKIMLFGGIFCLLSLYTNCSGFKTTPLTGIVDNQASSTPVTPGSPQLSKFLSSPESIRVPQSSTISWSVNDATSVSLNGTPVTNPGSMTVSPNVTTTYILSASNSRGTTKASITVAILEPLPATDLTISIESNTTFQKMDGFGSSVRLFDDPHVTETFNAVTKRAAVVVPPSDQNKILELLYKTAGLSIVRPIVEDKVEVANDNADPNTIDFSKFDFSWKNGDGYIDYIKRAAPLGATNYFLSPVYPETWMTEANPEECAEHALANLIHWRDMGLVMPYYSIYNEPGWFQGKTTRSGEFLRDVIKILGPKMRSLGFQTEIIIPDEVEAASAARKAATILSDPVARQYVGKIATHLYGNKISQMQDLKQVSEEYKVPLWMTEFSVYALDTTDFTRRDFVGWAAFMHEMISTYNTSAILYMWSTFGQWDGSGTMLVQINNNANNYVGYTPMKSLYSTAQFSKFIRPGSVRTKALGGSSEVLVSSYKLGGTSVVVAINLSGSSKTITVNLGSLGSGVSQIFPSRTSASENTVQLQSIPVVNTSFQTSLPANSITTFTTDASAY